MMYPGEHMIWIAVGWGIALAVIATALWLLLNLLKAIGLAGL
jgi:hypothetical protein